MGSETAYESGRSRTDHSDQSGLCPAWNGAAVRSSRVQETCRPALKVKIIFGALDRERCIVKLGILAGMPWSEIFGLKRGNVERDHVQIVEQVARHRHAKDGDIRPWPRCPTACRQTYNSHAAGGSSRRSCSKLLGLVA